MTTLDYLRRMLHNDLDTERESTRRMVIGVVGAALVLDLLMIMAGINAQQMLVVGVLLLIALILAWRGILWPGQLLVPAASLALFGYLMFLNKGLRDTAILGLPIVILSASLMVGRWGAVLYGALSLLLITCLGLAEASGSVRTVFSEHNALSDYFAASVSIVLITVLQWLIIGRLNDSVRRARENEQAQLSANRQLREVQVALEARMAELKQAESALRASEQKYRSFVEESLEGFVLTDEQGAIVEWNRAQERITGLCRENVLGSPLWDVQIRMLAPALQSAARAEATRASVQQALQTGQAPFFDRVVSVEICRPDGQRVSIEQSAFPIKTDRGYCCGSTARDVTARKRSEEALRNSEALYQSLVEILPMSMCRKDPDGRFTFVNQRYCAEFKLPASEILGKTDFDLHPADLAEKYQEDDRVVMAAGRSIEIVEEHEPIGGERTYVQVFKSPVFDAAGQPNGVQIVFWNITDRKRAEFQREATLAALRESEQRYRTLVETFPDIIMITDFTGQVVYANAALERQTGLTLQDLQPPLNRIFIHPDDLEVVRRAISELLTSDKSHTDIIENRFIDKYDRVHWYSGVIAKTQYEGRPVLQTVTRDITSRKQIEAERETLIAELESRNAELERFTYTVSHDLKSPLVTITGFLGYLEKHALSGNTDKLQEDVKRISTAAGKMQYLLNDLLELSRIGRMMNPPDDVPLAAIVQEAIELAQGRIEARGMQIEVQPDLPVVQGDRVRLVEVLQNLIDNACKFMGDQPEPRITIGCRGTDRDGKLIVFVQDNGLGIDPQYHERIFGLFDKLDPRSEGTGIGLALVKRIIEVHSGRIWVESAGAQAGAAFCFTLPTQLTT